MIEAALVSCDDHLDLNMLPADVWQKRMAAKWGERAPRVEISDKGGSVDKAPFKPTVEDFYLTNPIARASAVMAECSRLVSGQMLTAAE